jgi:ATP-dependent Lhr-like helicase
VIVDEIHAVIGTRRGAHLALSLERLQQVVERPLLRIGLSATQKPIDEVARFLTGGAGCAIVDEGHRRAMDPRARDSALAARGGHGSRGVGGVLRSARALIQAHRTTLVFVNTRRMAERLARHLSDRSARAR